MNTQEVTQQYRLNQWMKLIQECNNSGENVQTWCRNNNIKPNSYYYWLRKIRTAACKALPELNTQNQIVPIDVSLGTSIISSNESDVSSETSQADVILHFGSSVLEIHNNASINLIENIIKVLKNVR